MYVHLCISLFWWSLGFLFFLNHLKARHRHYDSFPLHPLLCISQSKGHSSTWAHYCHHMKLFPKFSLQVFSHTLWASQMMLMVKNPSADTGDIRDAGLIFGSGRSTGGGNGNPRKYSCLENPLNREAWWAIVHRVTKNWTQLTRLCTFPYDRAFHWVF